MKKVVFVTGNQGKLKEVQSILSGVGVEVLSHKIDLPELQGEVDEISIEKCRLAVKSLEQDDKWKDQLNSIILVIEDTSLCFNALKGLPGPYIKWFFEKLGGDGLNQMIAGFEDKTAYALCVLSFVDFEKGKEPKVIHGRTDGKIVPPKGDKNFGWDPIFVPKGYNETFAEISESVKNSLSHRVRAFQKFKEYLEECVCKK